MSAPENRRPLCPLCDALMVMELDEDWADDIDAHYWTCRHHAHPVSPCPGERVTAGGARYSTAFRAEDLALQTLQPHTGVAQRVADAVAAIDRTLSSLARDNLMRAYLSTAEQECIDASKRVLEGLSDAHLRAQGHEQTYHAMWQELFMRTQLETTDAAELARTFVGPSYARGCDRVRCLDDFVRRHSVLTCDLRARVHAYATHPHVESWKHVLAGVIEVLCIEGYNVRLPVFERYWQSWQQDLHMRRSLRQLSRLSRLDPDSYARVLAGQYPDRPDNAPAGR